MAKFKSNYEMTLVEEIKAARAAEAEAKKSVKKSFEMPTFNAEWQKDPPIDYKERYKQLETDFKKGIVPDEWVEIYDKLRALIKERFVAGGCTRLAEQVVVSHSFYRKYFYFYSSFDKRGMYSPGRFLNGYLTRRLKAEGFKTACIRLRHEVGNPWADSMNANLDAQYKRDLAEWQEKKLRYDNYANSPDYTLGGVANPGAAPTAPTHYSRTESISYFIISCAMGVDRRMKKYPISVAEHEEQRATGRRVIK